MEELLLVNPPRRRRRPRRRWVGNPMEEMAFVNPKKKGGKKKAKTMPHGLREFWGKYKAGEVPHPKTGAYITGKKTEKGKKRKKLGLRISVPPVAFADFGRPRTYRVRGRVRLNPRRMDLMKTLQDGLWVVGGMVGSRFLTRTLTQITPVKDETLASVGIAVLGTTIPLPIPNQHLLALGAMANAGLSLARRIVPEPIKSRFLGEQPIIVLTSETEGLGTYVTEGEAEAAMIPAYEESEFEGESGLAVYAPSEGVGVGQEDFEQEDFEQEDFEAVGQDEDEGD